MSSTWHFADRSHGLGILRIPRVVLSTIRYARLHGLLLCRCVAQTPSGMFVLVVNQIGTSARKTSLTVLSSLSAALNTAAMSNQAISMNPVRSHHANKHAQPSVD